MENKINYGRMMLGGILGAVVLFAVGFLVHGVFLKDHYEFFKGSSVWDMAHPKKYGMIVHVVGTIISGLALSMIYVAVRKFGGPGPMTAIKVGIAVALFTTGGIAAEYAFYNFGKMIPLMTLSGDIAGAIFATLVAGLVYKD